MGCEVFGKFVTIPKVGESGTDGHRAIGRTWHVSRWTNSAPAEAICLSTGNALPLLHPQMIRSPLPLTIRGFYLCLATLTPDLILAGRSQPRHGIPCSSGSSRGSHSVTSPVLTAYRMRRSGGCCVLRVAAKWDVRAGSPTYPGHLVQPRAAAGNGRSRSVVCSRSIFTQPV
jgi:hypothetical protein